MCGSNLKEMNVKSELVMNYAPNIGCYCFALFFK
jgi:hypothetical protein